MLPLPSLVWWLLLPFVLIVAVALWLSESQAQRIVCLHRAGKSQAAIAKQLNISRYQVRKVLAK